MSLFAVGSYTKHSSLDARGAGVTVVRWTDNDEPVVVDVGSEITNPSYLDWVPEQRLVYAVSEVGERMGAVAVYAADGSGFLRLLGQREGLGKSACHVKAIPDRERVYTASYSDGRLTSYRLESGIPVSVVMSRQYDGSGPNPARQEGPHAHQVVTGPGNRRLYICDLGSDAVWMHSLDDVDDADSPPEKALSVPAGYGPRHLAFDPESSAAYVLCELVPKLLVASIDRQNGRMTLTGEWDTVDDSVSGAAPAAVKVHPSGRTVAVSNRFDDTIAVFTIRRTADPVGAGTAPKLELAERFPCGGKTPRDISFDTTGRRLFIANQDSHSITCRWFDSGTGRPAEKWDPPMEIGSPVCVVMLD